MSIETNTQKITSAVEKAIAEVGARFEAAVGEFTKLQSKGLEQANVVIESATRATQEQIAFAEALGTEFRKLVLQATKGAADFFTPKA